MATRKREIKKNVEVFDKLSPSGKIRYVEQARKRLKYFRTLRVAKPSGAAR